MLELTTQALVCLLQAQPTLADQVPSLGHIPRLCRQMAIQNSQPSVYKTAILILHQLATSEVSLFDFVCAHACMIIMHFYFSFSIYIFTDLYLVHMPNRLYKSVKTRDAIEKRHDCSGM